MVKRLIDFVIYTDLEGEDQYRAMSLIEDLPLRVNTYMFDIKGFRLKLNEHSQDFFLIYPEDYMVAFEGLEGLSSRKFSASFIGDEFFVRYKRNPITGIFLRTYSEADIS